MLKQYIFIYLFFKKATPYPQPKKEITISTALQSKMELGGHFWGDSARGEGPPPKEALAGDRGQDQPLEVSARAHWEPGQVPQCGSSTTAPDVSLLYSLLQ